MIITTFNPATIFRFYFLLLMLVLSAFDTIIAQIRWTTTRDGQSSGLIGIERCNIRVTDHGSYFDIEEEAWLVTTEEVRQGDDETLEIEGRFILQDGSVIVGALVWDGNSILKGRLKSRSKAREQYENVVQRGLSRSETQPRDPVLIEKLSIRENQGMVASQYRILIYPVVHNKPKQIRIRYIQPHTSMWRHIPTSASIGSVFNSMGELAFANSVKLTILDKIGNKKYSFNDYASLHRWPKRRIPSKFPVRSSFLSKSKVEINNSFKTYVHYCGRLYKPVNNENNCDYARVTAQFNNEKAEALIPLHGLRGRLHHISAGFIISSQSEDNPALSMRLVCPEEQEVPDSVFKRYEVRNHPDNDTLLAILCAGYAAQTEPSRGLEATYGFISERFSLLALPEDEISNNEYLLYQFSGVPKMFKKYIYSYHGNIFSLGIKPPVENVKAVINKARNHLKIHLPTDLYVENIMLIDVMGRIISHYNVRERISSWDITLSGSTVLDGITIVIVTEHGIFIPILI